MITIIDYLIKHKILCLIVNKNRLNNKLMIYRVVVFLVD